MGTISGENPNYFKSAVGMYSKVKRFLSSFAGANLIDEGEFPTYIKEVLRDLGIGVYKEQDAVIKVKNFKAPLPIDFAVLDAAYKCTASFTSKDKIHPQGGTRVFSDITWEVLGTKDGCVVDCCTTDSKILESVTVRRYVEEKAETIGSFTNPVLLRLSPNVKRNQCTSDCSNLLASSPYEITINNHIIYTNFSNDSIYMKYWGLPLDEDGVPEIPDIEKVEKAIEWYIIWQITLKWWYNNQVPDMERRAQYSENKFGESFDRAKTYIKTPTFARMVNWIRRSRSVNKVQLMRQIDNNSYWS